MMRTRLLWYAMSFSATGAAVAQFVWKELWTDRYAISADTQEKFDALEARVLNLESNLSQGQDYIFVRGFVSFVSSVLIKAWKGSDDSGGDMEVLLGGMAALNDEIQWFKTEASKWGVQLSDIVPQKANKDYCS